MTRALLQTKIEKLGLAEECLKLRSQGLSPSQIAKKLNDNCDAELNGGNISSFMKSVSNLGVRDKDIMKQLDRKIAKTSYKIFDKWDLVDDNLNRLLKEASSIQEKFVGVDKKSGQPVIVKMKDLRLWKDVLGDIARISEIRAKLIGELKPHVSIQINNIENQYNDLKQIVVDAENEFPGLTDYIQSKLLGKGKQEKM